MRNSLRESQARASKKRSHITKVTVIELLATQKEQRLSVMEEKKSR